MKEKGEKLLKEIGLQHLSNLFNLTHKLDCFRKMHVMSHVVTFIFRCSFSACLRKINLEIKKDAELHQHKWLDT